MRLIDDKGRLFGMVNLIDLSVLMLILAAVASIVINFMAKPCGRENAADMKANEKMSVEVIETKVLFTNVMKIFLQDPNVLASGSTVLNGNAEIVKVLEVTDLPKNGGVIDMCNVTVLLRIKCVNLLGDYYCNNIPIKINSPLAISNPYYALSSGIILGMRLIKDE